MKREIKFKAKKVDNNEWVYGCLLINKTTDSYRIVSDFALCKSDVFTEDSLTHCSGEFNNVRKQTVCQFTGLKDKNGTEIYENDIIEDFKGFNYVVKIEDGMWWGEIIQNDTKSLGLEPLFFDQEIVIGNIHD